jgi:hypothetical protein
MAMGREVAFLNLTEVNRMAWTLKNALPPGTKTRRASNSAFWMSMHERATQKLPGRRKHRETAATRRVHTERFGAESAAERSRGLHRQCLPRRLRRHQRDLLERESSGAATQIQNAHSVPSSCKFVTTGWPRRLRASLRSSLADRFCVARSQVDSYDCSAVLVLDWTSA